MRSAVRCRSDFCDNIAVIGEYVSPDDAARSVVSMNNRVNKVVAVKRDGFGRVQDRRVIENIKDFVARSD
mgnify:CR=1 FL=1